MFEQTVVVDLAISLARHHLPGVVSRPVEFEPGPDTNVTPEHTELLSHDALVCSPQCSIYYYRWVPDDPPFFENKSKSLQLYF